MAATQVQEPRTVFDPSNVPLNHLVSLRAKLSQIIESLTSLTHIISGDEVAMGMASWPEILAKYNNLLAQSHTLVTTLSGVHLPQPARKPGEARRERGNPFENIVFHPLLMDPNPPSSGSTAAQVPGSIATNLAGTAGTTTGTIDEAHHGMLENLLRTDPHPQVIKRWDESVRRFVERRKGGGAGGQLDVLVGGDPTREARDILKEMTGIREGHDARVERAIRVIEDLKDKWDWKARVNLDDEDEDSEDLFGDAEQGETQESARMAVDDSDEKMKAQSQATVHMDTQQSQSQNLAMDTQQTQQTAPPAPTQTTVAEEEDMFSASDDDEDDDDLEDVMND